MTLRASSASKALPLLALASLGALLCPRSADACQPPPCYSSDRWQSFELSSPTISAQGVIVFDARRGEGAALADAEVLQFVSAEVTADGQPISGSLEVDANWRGLVWRPDAPFPANASVSVSLSVDNDAIPDEGGGCEPTPQLGPFAVEVSDAAIPGLDTVETDASAELITTEVIGLEGLVCCDGAYPAIEDFCFYEVEWSEGHCEPTESIGRVSTQWSVDAPQLPAELWGNLGWRVVTQVGTATQFPGQSSAEVGRTAPLCGHIELRNFATGEELALEEQCFGEDFADQLGSLPLDPGPGLEAMCSGEAYTCEIVLDIAEAWDPEACTPYETAGDGDGDGDTGGDGDGDSDSSGDGDGDGDSSGDGDGDGASTGDGDSGETGDAGLDESSDGDGCSCTSTQRKGGAAPALGLLVLGVWLRRRRHS